MNENITPPPNSSRNLALERQEAVKLHNEILKEQENLPDTEKQESTDKVAEMSTLREKVQNIDTYKDLAKRFNDQYYYRVGDISSVENLKKEKEKIDIEVEKVKLGIEDTTRKLNELRQKLGMEPTTDIPSLDIKKERLPYLLKTQDDLHGQLDFEIKKQESLKEENTENSKMEQYFLKNSLEEVSSSLRRVSGMIDERQSQGFQDIFSDPTAFRYIASGLEDFSDNEELKAKLSKLGSIVEDFARPSLNDHPDSMRELASKLSQLESSLRELPSKIKNEEERQEFGRLVSSVASKVDEAVSFIRRKAGQLEEARNF